MKIKVIMTGGTIGSESISGVIYNKPNKDITDISQNPNFRDIEFEKVYPYSILSENIALENWQSLTEELDRDNSGYDGIIITHGSDTLSYTSAMVSIYCQDTKIPIVLTGSDKVLTDPSANGLPNLAKATELIRENRCGVWTVFDRVFPANEITEADCFTDRFSQGKCSAVPTKVKRNIKLKKRVLMLKEYPFFDYSCIEPTEDIGAVLLVCYHSGTANESSVSRLIEKCRNRGIKLWLQGLKPNREIYSSTEKLIKNGAVPLYGVTPEYALAELTFMINSGLEVE